MTEQEINAVLAEAWFADAQMIYVNGDYSRLWESTKMPKPTHSCDSTFAVLDKVYPDGWRVDINKILDECSAVIYCEYKQFASVNESRAFALAEAAAKAIKEGK